MTWVHAEADPDGIGSTSVREGVRPFVPFWQGRAVAHGHCAGGGRFQTKSSPCTALLESELDFAVCWPVDTALDS